MNLSDFKPMQERCSNCSYCKFIPFDKVQSARFADGCPAVAYHNFNTYSARGRFQLGLALVNGEQPVGDATAQIIHSCLSCGACDVSCKICRYNLEPLEHNIALKEEAVRQAGPLGRQTEMLASLEAEHTLLAGQKAAQRGEWARGLEFSAQPEALYFPGCKYSYDPALRQTARTGAELLLKAGVKLGYLGENDACCGGRLWQMGMSGAFDAQAERMIGRIRECGAAAIVTPCSDCYHAFKRLYAKAGLEVQVLHIVEYLDKLIAEGRMTFSKEQPITVTYHDPCHLGRQGESYLPWAGQEKKILNQVHTWEPRRPRYNGAYGIYDAPRRILEALPGVKLVEMERIREYSWCCGAGGGCSETDPEFSRWTAAERIEEARATGAEVLVTACPWCKSNFNTAGGIKVEDILDLVARAM